MLVAAFVVRDLVPLLVASFLSSVKSFKDDENKTGRIFVTEEVVERTKGAQASASLKATRRTPSSMILECCCTIFVSSSLLSVMERDRELSESKGGWFNERRR